MTEPDERSGNIYCGTCGWTDRTLIQSGFYPPHAKSAADRLSYYAHQFPLVEVDATYYAPPSQRNAELWAERTPVDFTFNIKAYGLLTHHPVATRTLPKSVQALLQASALDKKRVYPDALPAKAIDLLWRMHVEALRPLADLGKLGCVLFQFPPWFRKNRENVSYLEQLPDKLPYQIAVEFRGGGWMDEERQQSTLEILERKALAYVVVDEPQGFKSSVPPVLACTAPLAVVRFHGRNAQTWEKRGISVTERFKYLYSEDELKEWIGPIRRLAAQADRVHALMNNCYADYAMRNARQLAALLA
ncbi:MAG: DUF72 domain-containing protein [Gammaproteobacteria bacterium]